MSNKLNESNLLTHLMENKNPDFDEVISSLHGYQLTLMHKLDAILKTYDLDENSDTEAKARFLLSLKDVNDIIKNLSRLSNNLSNSLYKKRSIEISDDIDFTHPKIQRGFYFLIEVFLDTLKEVGVEEDVVGAVTNSLSAGLIGFEEKLNKELKTIASNLVNDVDNPLKNK